MSWKKRLSVLSAAALLTVFTLSGCGSSSDSASGTASTGTTASSGKGLTGDFEVQYFVGGYGDAGGKKL